MALKLNEKKKISKIQSDFLSFVKHIWPDFIQGYHHKIVANKFNDLSTGKIKRLIVNMPPRHTKSEFASALLPAWMIGRNPNSKLYKRPTPESSQLDSGVKQKHWLILPSTRKFLRHDLEKIHKRREDGKQRKAASTSQPVSAEPLQDGVLTYWSSMIHTPSKMRWISAHSRRRTSGTLQDLDNVCNRAHRSSVSWQGGM